MMTARLPRPLVLAVLAALASALPAAGGDNLTLVRTIPLPHVEGRIDHLAIDEAGARLFVAALGNDTVEVVDLKTGAVAHTIVDLAEPQGVFFVPRLNRLFVATGGNGTLRVFEGTTFADIATLQLSSDADNVRYDAAVNQIYVGYGNGALGVVDAATNAIVAKIPLAAHPEGFQLEPDGALLFVNVPGAHQVAVVDRAQRKVVATWPTGAVAANYPMALDAPDHRLFVGCRAPPRLLVLDTRTGAEVDRLSLHDDCDDVFFDAARHQVYASCGEGFLDVFTRTDARRYRRTESVATADKARTCGFDGRRLYVAAPRWSGRDAAVRVYEVH